MSDPPILSLVDLPQHLFSLIVLHLPFETLIQLLDIKNKKLQLYCLFGAVWQIENNYFYYRKYSKYLKRLSLTLSSHEEKYFFNLPKTLEHLSLLNKFTISTFNSFILNFPENNNITSLELGELPNLKGFKWYLEQTITSRLNKCFPKLKVLKLGSIKDILFNFQDLEGLESLKFEVDNMKPDSTFTFPITLLTLEMKFHHSLITINKFNFPNIHLTRLESFSITTNRTNLDIFSFPLPPTLTNLNVVAFENSQLSAPRAIDLQIFPNLKFFTFFIRKNVVTTQFRGLSFMIPSSICRLYLENIQISIPPSTEIAFVAWKDFAYIQSWNLDGLSIHTLQTEITFGDFNILKRVVVVVSKIRSLKKFLFKNFIETWLEQDLDFLLDLLLSARNADGNPVEWFVRTDECCFYQDHIQRFFNGGIKLDASLICNMKKIKYISSMSTDQTLVDSWIKFYGKTYKPNDSISDDDRIIPVYMLNLKRFSNLTSFSFTILHHNLIEETLQYLPQTIKSISLLYYNIDTDQKWIQFPKNLDFPNLDKLLLSNIYVCNVPKTVCTLKLPYVEVPFAFKILEKMYSYCTNNSLDFYLFESLCTLKCLFKSENTKHIENNFLLTDNMIDFLSKFKRLSKISTDILDYSVCYHLKKSLKNIELDCSQVSNVPYNVFLQIYSKFSPDSDHLSEKTTFSQFSSIYAPLYPDMPNSTVVKWVLQSNYNSKFELEKIPSSITSLELTNNEYTTLVVQSLENLPSESLKFDVKGANEVQFSNSSVVKLKISQYKPTVFENLPNFQWPCNLHTLNLENCRPLLGSPEYQSGSVNLPPTLTHLGISYRANDINYSYLLNIPLLSSLVLAIEDSTVQVNLEDEFKIILQNCLSLGSLKWRILNRFFSYSILKLKQWYPQAEDSMPQLRSLDISEWGTFEQSSIDLLPTPLESLKIKVQIVSTSRSTRSDTIAQMLNTLEELSLLPIPNVTIESDESLDFAQYLVDLMRSDNFKYRSKLPELDKWKLNT